MHIVLRWRQSQCNATETKHYQTDQDKYDHKERLSTETTSVIRQEISAGCAQVNYRYGTSSESKTRPLTRLWLTQNCPSHVVSISTNKSSFKPSTLSSSSSIIPMHFSKDSGAMESRLAAGTFCHCRAELLEANNVRN